MKQHTIGLLLIALIIFATSVYAKTETVQPAVETYTGFFSQSNPIVDTDLGLSMNFESLPDNYTHSVVVYRFNEDPIHVPKEKRSLGNHYELFSTVNNDGFTTELIFHYTDEQIQDIEEDTLDIYYYNGIDWIPLNAEVDENLNVVKAKIDHLSSFAVLGMKYHASHSSSQISTFNDNTDNLDNCDTLECPQPEIPEFGVIGAALGVTIAFAGFLIMRKKE
jgi:hypothetical protein